jgi:hypothetical protein
VGIIKKSKRKEKENKKGIAMKNTIIYSRYNLGLFVLNMIISSISLYS